MCDCRAGVTDASKSMPVLTPQATLGIFAKAPVAGQVKTRLAIDIGAAAAATWYAQSLRVIFTRTRAAWPEVERILFFDPPDAESAFDVFPAAPAHRVAQVGEDLGARMAAAFQYCFAQGAHGAVLIGSDAPTLPHAYLTEAWHALSTCDVVLGPAEDGGYYLIGLRAVQPALFTAVEWSTPTVLDVTMRRARALGLATHSVPEWFDVDTVHDLARLPAEWDRADPP